MAISLYDGWHRYYNGQIRGWRSNREWPSYALACDLAARAGGMPLATYYSGAVPVAWAVFVTGYLPPRNLNELMCHDRYDK